MESVNTTEMTVNGLSYREYHNLHGCLPDEVIEHLLDISAGCDHLYNDGYDDGYKAGSHEKGASKLRKKLSEIADIVNGY